MSVERTTADGGMATAFGFREVGDGEKQPLVNDVFHTVARRYDIMNDLMSAGLHRVWKGAFVDWLSPPKRTGLMIIPGPGMKQASTNAAMPAPIRAARVSLYREESHELIANRIRNGRMAR